MKHISRAAGQEAEQVKQAAASHSSKAAKQKETGERGR